MKHHQLGGSDLRVSNICLGTMTWGEQNTEAEAQEQLDLAIAQGINFIDTAELYPIPPNADKQGRTETYIGNWLQASGRREELVIATKVAGPNPYMGTRSGPIRLDRANIKQAIEGSLERLQTDYVDLYQVHWPQRPTNFFGQRGFVGPVDDGEVNIEETLSALGELVQAGLVRYIGVSNETPWGVMEYLRLAETNSLPRIISIQNQYSLINRTFEIGLSEVCMRQGVDLLPYSVLSMGVLSGKYLDGNRPAGARFSLSERNGGRYNSPEVQEAVREYVELAQAHDLDPAQMSLAYVMAQPFVGSTIIGASRLDQLEADIKASSIKLSDEVLSGIADIHRRLPDVQV